MCCVGVRACMRCVRGLLASKLPSGIADSSIEVFCVSAAGLAHFCFYVDE